MKKVNMLKKILLIGLMMPILLSLSLFGANSVRIMPLGDSITKGLIIPEDPVNQSGYRGPLWSKLLDGGYNFDLVGSFSSGENYDPSFDSDHQGKNGRTTAELNDFIDTYLDTEAPQIVLLHIGTNDIDQPEYSLTSSTNNVKSILDKIYAHDSSIKILLARIINRQDYDQDTTTFNDSVAAMASAHIADIDIVDMEDDAGIDYTIDMSNLKHPNDSGYTKMADLWYSSLKSVIPMHLWKLDETNGSPYLDSYRDANGTCAGDGCPFDIVGKIDGAQGFNGTHEINVTDTPTFNWAANDSFTIEFWMKTDTDTVNNEHNIMMGQRSNSNATGLAWFIGIEKADGRIKVGLNDSNDISFTQSLGNNIIVSDSEWHHIAYVRNGNDNTTKVYVDGTLDDTQNHTYDAPLNDGNQPVTIGYLDWENFKYDGALDEIAVFDSALNATQVLQHYQAGKITIISDPVTLSEVNVLYSYDVISNRDPDAIFRLKTSPSWLSINEISGLISGTSITNNVGNVDIEVEAEDINNDEIATQNYVLKIRNTSILPNGMVHYWKLDEITGSPYFDDYSGADATCTGLECPDVTGEAMVGNAQVFDSTKKIDVTDTPTFNWVANDSFTIEFWMKTDTDTVNNEHNIMMGQRSNSNATGLAWFIGIEKADGRIKVGLNDSNDISFTQSLGNNIIVSDSEWHHIAYVRNGNDNTTKVYVDGTLDDTQNHTYDAPLNDGNQPVTIGYLDWENFKYDGALDEIAVFDSALSQSEIQKHVDQGKAGKGFETPTGNVPVIAPIITYLLF